MELYDAMSTLRAVRRLRSDPIPIEVLERVLQAACWSPTGGNQQPWRILAISDPVLKQGLADLYGPEWRQYASVFMDRIAGAPDEDKWKRVVAAGDYLADHLHEAPVILLFCADPRRMAITDRHLDRVSMVGGGSVYPAVQNAMLACRHEDLGCVLTTLHCKREPEVKALLDIPEEWATVAMIPIGYPVGTGHGPITRKGPDAMAFQDRWGNPWSSV